jgi:hypothetical protein
LPISIGVWASAAELGMSYKRLLNPKVLASQRRPRLSAVAVATDFGWNERVTRPSGGT